MASINKEFTGTENELKEAAYYLIKLHEAAKNYDTTLSLPERKLLKHWTGKVGDWIERNIKTKED